MASTRNKNTPGNYHLEQKQYQGSNQYNLYTHSQHGEAWNTNLCGNGLMPGQLPRDKLSTNSVQIESFLFGINSTNLVNPQGPITANLVQLQPIDIYTKSRVIMPDPLVVEKNRPYEK
ncbi:MAG: hypothetical protein WCJ33_10075 [Pseudomonadota bacterium]